MDSIDLIACGILWRKTEDPDAGWELIEGLHSPDPELSTVAESMLVQAGWPSVGLVERALELGLLRPSEAGRCMAALFGKAQFSAPPRLTTNFFSN